MADIGPMDRLTHAAPAPDAERLPRTSRSVPIALLRARENVMVPIRKMLLAAGVTEQQWRVLRVLHENGVMEPQDLARGACLIMPSLTRIVQGLERRKLVARSPHPSDGRKFLLQATPAGLAVIDDNIAESNRIAADLERRFGAEKLNDLLDLLGELSEL